MARSYNPRDVYAVVNSLVKQATGRQDVTVTDLSSFVSAGELIMGTGTENVLNALSIIVGRTLVAVRPYKAPLSIINAIDTGMYTNRLRKISYYSKDAKVTGAFNTQLTLNLAETYTNGQNPDSNGNAQSTKSMWEQNQPIPLEMNFGGQSVWQDSMTIYEDQLKVAFRSPEEFDAFYRGFMTEKANDMESQKESFNRLTLLNMMAGTYDFEQITPNGRVVNLTAAYNAKFGTQYTSEQLRTTYLKSFLEFMVSTFRIYSDRMTHRSAAFHWTPAKTDAAGNSLSILRHTPKDKQKMILYKPLFIEATAMVLPEIFNDEYLKIENYEGVDYWQALDGDGSESPKISVTPAIPTAVVTNTTDGTQTAGTAVALDYVVGCLYDEDAMMTDYQLDSALTTPIEARKHYRNIWWTYSRNSINDFTENFILFTMEDATSDDEGGEGGDAAGGT